MASLIENLITELNEEYAVYQELLKVSMEKTPAIIANDLQRLTEVSDREELLVDTVTGMENARRQTMNNIASVLNKKSADIKVRDIVEFLDGQPQFQEPLAEINEKLSKLAKQLREVNLHNQSLITEALSMIEYNINLLQNINRAPETAEYSREMFRGKGAAYSGGQDSPAGKFDAKQ
jgi:flagellar biosynthesis/type III secretory pathway chaperone